MANNSQENLEKNILQLKQEAHDTKIQLQNAKTTQESLENILQEVRAERNQFEQALHTLKTSVQPTPKVTPKKTRLAKSEKAENPPAAS